MKMNPKRRVFKITNRMILKSSSGDFDTELQMLHSKMQTSDQHQK